MARTLKLVLVCGRTASPGRRTFRRTKRRAATDSPPSWPLDRWRRNSYSLCFDCEREALGDWRSLDSNNLFPSLRRADPARRPKRRRSARETNKKGFNFSCGFSHEVVVGNVKSWRRCINVSSVQHICELFFHAAHKPSIYLLNSSHCAL